MTEVQRRGCTESVDIAGLEPQGGIERRDRAIVIALIDVRRRYRQPWVRVSRIATTAYLEIDDRPIQLLQAITRHPQIIRSLTTRRAIRRVFEQTNRFPISTRHQSRFALGDAIPRRTKQGRHQQSGAGARKHFQP